MFQKLNPQSGVPAYQQIVGQIKHAIELGQLKAGDALPSIRQFAETVLVNPNTIVRAFRELENEGVVRSHPAFAQYMVPPRGGRNVIQTTRTDSCGARLSMLVPRLWNHSRNSGTIESSNSGGLLRGSVH